MSEELKDILRLLDAFEQSDWASVHVRVGDLDVSLSVDPDAPHPSAVSSGAVAAASGAPAPPPAAATPAPAAPATAPPAPVPAAAAAAVPPRALDPEPGAGPAAAAVPPQTPQPAQADKAARAEAGGTPVLAPSPGIFWRSPSPGAAPFVDVGDEVSPETTVCIVELMKLMNHVLAGVTGTVSAVLVGNGELVEMGQPILLVDGP